MTKLGLHSPAARERWGRLTITSFPGLLEVGGVGQIRVALQLEVVAKVVGLDRMEEGLPASCGRRRAEAAG